MNLLTKIGNQLKKRKEKVIFDLYIKDYDHSNFYFALVFNEKIEKFKVLYVPLDVIESRDHVEDYFCYQFVLISNVNYLLETVHKGQESINNISNNKNNTISNYYLEMNTHVGGVDLNYTFNQYISKEYPYLFDVVVALFEYSPNIVSELCNKILMEFLSFENALIYNGSYSKDLNSFEELFSLEVRNDNTYTFDDISYIEKVGNRYFAIINEKIIIVDIFERSSMININSGEYDVLGREVFIVLKAIRESLQKDFLRIEVDNQYYLCYGIHDNEFKIVQARGDISFPISLVSKEKIKFLSRDKRIENDLEKCLKVKYEDFKVKEFMKKITS